MTPQEITDHLRSLADPERAELVARYFKTAPGEYGHGDKFLGLAVPVVRKAVKQYAAASLATAEKLLQSEYHEIRLFALLLLVARHAKADAAEQDEVYRFYLNNTRYINNWDLVDSSAPYIVGAYLLDRDKSILYELAASPSLWERRIAVLSTFWFIREGRFDDSLRIAELLLNDREDLIHKAVGWMLREVGKRDLAVEEKFLKAHCRSMPRTMLRYAIEKFGEPERKKYLSGRA
ncbi:MAG TPA: DNA alkylation repair protein [Gallionellaceae bacterium]